MAKPSKLLRLIMCGRACVSNSRTKVLLINLSTLSMSHRKRYDDACKAADVPASAHKLRMATQTRTADYGAAEAELETICGWGASGRWTAFIPGQPIGQIVPMAL